MIIILKFSCENFALRKLLKSISRVDDFARLSVFHQASLNTSWYWYLKFYAYWWRKIISMTLQPYVACSTKGESIFQTFLVLCSSLFASFLIPLWFLQFYSFCITKEKPFREISVPLVVWESFFCPWICFALYQCRFFNPKLLLGRLCSGNYRSPSTNYSKVSLWSGNV